VIVLGCDVGALYTKIALLDADRPFALRLEPTGRQAAEGVGAIVDRVLSDAGIPRDRVDRIVTTGGGAALASFADLAEDEVHCVAAAAAFCSDRVDLIIHIGGQSAAAILLNNEGEVAEFSRNDKCASGSGRFLEMMTAKLGIALSDVDGVASRSSRPAALSSQCGVFAESEIISLANSGVPVPDLIAGVCDAVGGLATALARRFGAASHSMITGGVGRFATVRGVLRARLTAEQLAYPHDPIFAAAIGAAILGGGEAA
jgi:(R)-2-hydroxyacyl-CoA dehydratese activating ATPase